MGFIMYLVGVTLLAVIGVVAILGFINWCIRGGRTLEDEIHAAVLEDRKRRR